MSGEIGLTEKAFIEQFKLKFKIAIPQIRFELPFERCYKTALLRIICLGELVFII